ncbi:hypothetical protein ACFLWN_00305 [Chloroflexota bacterium]
MTYYRVPMVIKTRVFEMCDGKYCNLCEMAGAMGVSVSQVYRVREGKRSINQTFIVGALRAFPERTIGDLFYLDRKGIGEEF